MRCMWLRSQAHRRYDEGTKKLAAPLAYASTDWTDNREKAKDRSPWPFDSFRMETVCQMKGLLLPKFIARLERERNENRSDNIQRDNHHEAAIIRSEPALRQLGFLLKEG